MIINLKFLNVIAIICLHSYVTLSLCHCIAILYMLYDGCMCNLLIELDGKLLKFTKHNQHFLTRTC